MSQAPHLLVYSDAGTLAAAVGAWIAELVSQSPAPFALALSGGSTPKTLYELMARPPLSQSIEWDKLQFFFGDERFVPSSDERSNQRMAREALFDRAPITPGAIHAPQTTGVTLDAAARGYEEALQSYYGARTLDPARPLFDLTLLGLGTNGHTASLMPDTPALDERTRWVVGVEDGKVEPRLTLTYPAIASSRRVAFLVAGLDKRDMLKRLLQGDQVLPAARVAPVGELHIFADGAAAGEEA